MAQPNIDCSNPSTFNLCYSNWQSGGTVSICANQANSSGGGKAYNACLCQQYFQQAYCYNSFCPQDPTTAQVNSLRAQYCSQVPDFNPNANFGSNSQNNGSSATPITAPVPTGGSGPVLAIPTGPPATLTALPKQGGSGPAVDVVGGLMGLVVLFMAFF